ncbi:MAG: hypothetical protein ACREO0_08470 [Pseudoxanthomonas sp.]
MSAHQSRSPAVRTVGRASAHALQHSVPAPIGIAKAQAIEQDAERIVHSIAAINDRRYGIALRASL